MQNRSSPSKGATITIQWIADLGANHAPNLRGRMLVGFSDKQQIVEQIKTGTCTFLVDSNGDFVANSMELDELGSQ